MAEPPYRLHSLSLSGFRAYLKPKTFDFARKPSLAIYAPNGKGKSSVIDALEFVFSKDGTLDRLGQKAIHNQAGPLALVHNMAAESGVDAFVSILFHCDGAPHEGTRSATGKRDIPPAARSIAEQFVVYPFVRGHGLRRFVEEDTPQDRYTEVARWLNLAPLTEVQKNLRALRTQVKAASEDETAVNRVLGQLRAMTASTVKSWDQAAIVAYINQEALAPLHSGLAMATLAGEDPAYVHISVRAKAEEADIGVAALRVVLQSSIAVFAENRLHPDDAPVRSGRLFELERQAEARADAVAKEAEEREKAASAAFKGVWEAAKQIFAAEDAAPETCPVCVTPLADTAAGSAVAVKLHVETRLAELQDYSAAHMAMESAVRSSRAGRDRLIAALATLAGLLPDEAPVKPLIVDYVALLTPWDGGDLPDSGLLLTALMAHQIGVEARIAEVEAAQGDHTYRKAKATIDGILALANDYALAARTKAELEILLTGLVTQATAVSAAIRTKMQALLDTLQTPMQEIYHAIQGAGAPPVRLELPSEEDATQQRLMLLIDFAANRAGVQPAGYLSDSQLHSVALALRLAAIRTFNTRLPLIALDDVVTSYDADHRRSIAALLASFADTSQIIVTTHDERFFAFLHELLDANVWHHSRIIALESDGPRFSDHKISDEMVEARWQVGESAANEMRRAEEEWLLKICREFGAKLTIRPLEKPYAFDRGELASALAGVLGGLKLVPLAIPGTGNRFLVTLQKGEVENFGSHFQENPYATGSMGDEKTRWAEFKAFRDQFACPKCTRTKFKQPRDLKRPVCAHEKCGTPFEFAAPTERVIA